MDIKQEFREAKNMDVYAMNVNDGSFSNVYVKWLEAKINFTRCCTQLNHEDLAIGQQVSITQTKLVEINCFREDGDIDVEDTNSISKEKEEAKT